MAKDPIDQESVSSDWRIDVHFKSTDTLRNRCFAGGIRTDDRHVMCGYCSPTAGAHQQTHFAKWFTVCDREAESDSARSWMYFQRQAIVATRLGMVEFCRLDVPQPLIVYSRWLGSHLDNWLADQTQLVARSEWVAIAQKFLVQLEHLHRFGFVHSQLCLEHVWLTTTDEVRLIGLGHCELVGQPHQGRCEPAGHIRAGQRQRAPKLIAPELKSAGGESSSAEDIYSAAAVIDELCQGTFLQTPIGRCMQAENPYDRPTARELVELFTSYHRELTGVPRTWQSRAA